MTTRKIETLTEEQENLIPVYLEKWKKIALSTAKIDRTQLSKALKQTYVLMDFPEPEIIFYDSLYEIVQTRRIFTHIQCIYGNEYQPKTGIFSEYLSRRLLSYLCNAIENITFKDLGDKLQQYLNCELYEVFVDEFGLNIYAAISQIRSQISNEISGKQNQICETFRQSADKWDLPLWLLIDKEPDNPELSRVWHEWNHLSQQEEILLVIDGNKDYWIELGQWCESACLYDFCINILNCEYDAREWEILQIIAQNGGWVLPSEKMIIVCDRPTKFSFDEQLRLHSEAEPAVQFSDGYSLYASHGVTLPEKYGILHPNQWSAKWLLEEDNAELRRVLIQGIGYSRLLEELQAKELDYYQGYTLIKIDADVDEEPIFLLKMICPSTEFIHVLRVPPDMKSAQEAIRWVNWGIDPLDFAVQT
ncbi:hypothetical protein BV372_04385 [Nostoc sp. T09]|uniref:DUF6745 domain-containing protein n=1 Tax=Nostoc sp. T09 TaxID=1932621 RepID=UPI000B64598C|nr:hypothetical protein [Nostoc sp. T09]OUL37047.1 hypothetical protein BV372_04385 [Nostoc sp. T09]